MTNEQAKQAKVKEEAKENKQSGSTDNRVDEVGETNVYPVSEREGASDKAEVHTPADLGKTGQAGG